MSQSLARLCVHLVFSTKHRECLLLDSIRKDLHAYIATVLKNMECPALIINSVEDHIHILLDLNRTISISYVMEHVRRRNFLSVKVFKLDLEGDFKLLFFGGLLCS